MATVLGRRVPDETQWFALGDYGKLNGVWMAHAPGGGLGDLSQHDVVEHEDGTITVSSSILIENGKVQWHGYLERGVWRRV